MADDTRDSLTSEWRRLARLLRETTDEVQRTELSSKLRTCEDKELALVKASFADLTREELVSAIEGIGHEAYDDETDDDLRFKLAQMMTGLGPY